MLGMKSWTLQQWRMKGIGPAYTKLGKSIFYRVDDIKIWIEANVTSCTRSPAEEETTV